MSPNIDSSKKTFSTNQISTHSDNNLSNDRNQDNSKNNQLMPIKITITTHLCKPCPIFYTDIFNKVLIVCKDPSHKNISIHNDGDIKDRDDLGNIRNVDQTFVLTDRCCYDDELKHYSSDFSQSLDNQSIDDCNCNCRMFCP